MEPRAYNIVEQASAYPRYPTCLSIVEFLRCLWRGQPPPARQVTVTGLDTFLVVVSRDDRLAVARFLRQTLQDAASDLTNRHQTVQFVVRGHIDRGTGFEVREQSGDFVDLSAIFGNRLQQKENDWLVAPLWI
jgi:hypothetical protein